MRKYVFVALYLLCAGMLYGQGNIRDYYYPLNRTMKLEETARSDDAYVVMGVRTIQTHIENNQICCVQQIVPTRRGTVYSIKDYVTIKDNSVILLSRRKYVGTDYVDYNLNYPILKIPPGNKEIRWEGGDSKYVANQVTLPTRSGTISAIRVLFYYHNELESIEYWCKGWGRALTLNVWGSITSVNPSLFDEKLPRQKEITQWREAKRLETEQKDY